MIALHISNSLVWWYNDTKSPNAIHELQKYVNDQKAWNIFHCFWLK